MNKSRSYWKENINLIIWCLFIWFLSSYVFSIIMVNQLNTIRIGGYKLGFWFAQQGSIYIFVILIFYYAFKMDDIDKKYNRSNK